jgi:hypothetical protein
MAAGNLNSGAAAVRKIGCILAVALLGGCVHHTFAPGPGMSAMDFEPDTAQCRLFARGSRSGFAFAAVGSPKYVGAAMGGAALGYAIGSAIEKNQNFNDCMQARGWRVADGKSAGDPAMSASLAQAPIVQPAVATTGQPPIVLAIADAKPAVDPAMSVAPPPPFVQPAVATMIGQPPIVLASTRTSAPARNELLVRAADVTSVMADSVHLGRPRGVMILSVGMGGAAMVAGLREQDVILDFNGVPISSMSDMQRALVAVVPSSTVLANIWRDNTERMVEIRF